MANASSAPMAAMKQIMNIISSGTVAELNAALRNTYKLSNNVEKMGYAGVRPFLSTYIHPQDGSEFQGMNPLHLAVLTGMPEMVEEAMKFGTDLEMLSGNTLDPELAQKTPRGIADVLLARYNTPEKGSEMFKAVKSVLLRRGAKPKMKTTIMGKKLVFPENAANVQYYKNAVAMVNRMLGPPMSRKSRKNRKTHKNKTRRT
ncbi:MAG: hypothetical protein EBU33_08205 [Sphingobacteriia bacterium]|nr:hypothetical protein [Sphingobacteriia bacterium]